METNYEALGRYVSLIEQAKKLAGERHEHLAQAGLIISRTVNVSIRAGAVPDFAAIDFVAKPVHDEIDRAVEVHQRMVAVVNEANKQAELCGKPKLEIQPFPNYSKR